MFVVNELKKLENVDHIYSVRESFINILNNVINDFISNKTMFDMDNFEVVFYDEFTLETNCHKDIFSTIYLEINQPLNYKIVDKIINKKKQNKPTDKIIFPDLYMTLEKIIDELFDCFIRNMDQNNLIWLDDYSINIKSTININKS